MVALVMSVFYEHALMEFRYRLPQHWFRLKFFCLSSFYILRNCRIEIQKKSLLYLSNRTLVDAMLIKGNAFIVNSDLYSGANQNFVIVLGDN